MGIILHDDNSLNIYRNIKFFEHKLWRVIYAFYAQYTFPNTLQFKI
jgi:hypothetical protein